MHTSIILVYHHNFVNCHPAKVTKTIEHQIYIIIQRSAFMQADKGSSYYFSVTCIYYHRHSKITNLINIIKIQLLIVKCTLQIV